MVADTDQKLKESIVVMVLEGMAFDQNRRWHRWEDPGRCRVCGGSQTHCRGPLSP